MTRNQKTLALILTLQTIQKARRQSASPPPGRVMEALSEAIACKREELQKMTLAGELGSDAYRQASRQLAKWSAAWAANR